MKTNETRIGFIGAGNMASAIVRGLVKNHHPSDNIILSNPSQEKLQRLKDDLGVNITSNNQAVCDNSDIVILTVKPQKMADALQGINFANVSCVISVAAGLPVEKLKHYCGGKTPVLRAMPNTPATELVAATGLFAANDGKPFIEISEYIFGAIGKFIWVEHEGQIDTVTALAGSSPAYFFLFMEALIEAGIAQGMPEEQAKTLVVQSALGAATLINNHPDIEIAERRRQVTSPNGTTAAALDCFANHDFKNIVGKAVDAAVKRGKELAQS